MLIVTLGKIEFLGFALSLYYNSISKHVNKADEFFYAIFNLIKTQA